MFNLINLLYSRASEIGTPLGGTFELTPMCNMNCKMCYIRMSKEEMEKSGKMKTADEWLKIAEEAKAKGMLFLLLTGGEPFLYPEFWKLYKGLKKMGLFISINSNGTMLEGETLKKLIEDPPYRINITLYGGSDETYASLCQKPDGYTKTTNAIKQLKENNIFVKINSSITPFNCHDINKCFSFSQDVNAPIQIETYMFPPVRRDNKNTGRFNPVEAGKYQAQVEQLKYSDQELHDKIKNADNCNTGLVNKNKFRCRAGRSAFWINWKGKMTPCGMMEKFVQHPFETGFDKSWDAIRNNVMNTEVLKGCNNCPHKDICKVCPAVAFAETGDLNGIPKYYCEMQKSMWKELRKV